MVIGIVDNDVEEMIGFARAITDTLYRAFIFDVIAKENYRNSGIGIILMNNILDPLVRQIERVEVYCPERLLEYYKKFGFSRDVNGSNLMRSKK
ncbi:GNAT family N-acetyltransferase [Psychrobacillus sp. NPDC058041]|uniref:GNAT family N-acetyltransferase n=1 Tax=Psychrobacillus sp. NPDC058041 TaxID=3346310 RepID=UPI0036D88C56